MFFAESDFDQINDIRFYREHSSSPSYGSETFYVYSLSTIQFVCVPSTSDADSLPPGSILDANLNWNNNYNGAYFYYYFSSNIPPPWGQGSSGRLSI